MAGCLSVGTKFLVVLSALLLVILKAVSLKDLLGYYSSLREKRSFDSLRSLRMTMGGDRMTTGGEKILRASCSLCEHRLQDDNGKEE